MRREIRYLPHILLAYVALGLQRGLDVFMRWGETARIDLVFIAGGYLMACLPRTTAPIGALLLGFAYDLTGTGPVGLHAVAFALAGLATARITAERWGWLVGKIVAFVAMAALLEWLLGLLRLAGDQGWQRAGFAGSIGLVVLTGTALVPLSWPLWRLRRRLVAGLR